MAKLLVNLDALIPRADFAEIKEEDDPTYETFDKISINHFTNDGLTGKILRKPDFQRETNHWSPEQVCSLLECFINGELIPSVILWKSPTFLFVIDGGHRLSVLKAWVLDDYGDGFLSQKYFGDAVTENQKKAASKTRKLIELKLGSYQYFKQRVENDDIDKKVSSFISRALPVQWVKGDADKAEASFFKINTQGTPLDDIEELLLTNRDKPFAISARAIIRAGQGHKYWSKFDKEKTIKIEELAKELHINLFDPEIKRPIKNLDLPLGGSKGIRTALQIIIEYLSISNISQDGTMKLISNGNNDVNGEDTIQVLKLAKRLTNRITGNDKGSLGLHPAIYYYGPSGVHSSPLFLGTAKFISKKIINNDKDFFRKYSEVRENIEIALINNKELIATILQKSGSTRRIDTYAKVIDEIFKKCYDQKDIIEQDIIDWSGLNGKIIVGSSKTTSKEISEDVKSKVFIKNTLIRELKCPICEGYIDSNKSISYDHIVRKSEGGLGDEENVQITHPYCNQSVKN